jgi:hypothetical protein
MAQLTAVKAKFDPRCAACALGKNTTRTIKIVSFLP